MPNYYQPEIETASREQILAWQNECLVKQVNHVWNNVPYYRQKMEEKGVTPEDIKGVADLHKLPFLTKDDLREAYPYGLMGKPVSECVRIQSTSGTTGKRVVAFYTQHDIDLWEDCCARAIVAAGGTKDDVVQVCYGYGLFTGGPGLNGGSHRVGSLTLPMSSGNTERQLQFMTDLQSTILCCTPSYAAYLAESIHEAGLRDKIKLKAGIFGAEAWTEEMRHSIEESLGIKAYDIYGLTETSGPGVSFECSEQTGMHINEDHFIAEIINPETGEVLPEGEKGELVFTAITKEAFPLIRYRTRDICVLSRKPCSCGRTHVKMCKPMGRSDDMLIIRGVNVFPSQIETVLLEQGYPANYQIVVDRVNHNDTFEVMVEMPADKFSDSLAEINEKEKKLVGALKTMLGIKADVRLVSPKAIKRSEGKAVRVIDKRKLHAGAAANAPAAEVKPVEPKHLDVKQISVFLENEAGKLSEVTRDLAKAGIDMRALSIAETTGYGVLRIIVDDAQKATNELLAHGYLLSMTDVTVVEVPDQSGGLAPVLEAIAANNVDIEYMYSLFTHREGKAYMVFRVEKAEEFCRLLESKGFHPASKEELGLR